MNEPQLSERRCPKCGAQYPATAPEGLCPNCLLAMNLVAPTELSDLPGGPSAGTEQTPPLLPPRPEEIAPLFPQLEILESLGRGGMGVVYKARQRTLDRLVAIKLLAPEKVREPEFAARFQKEAQALARLNHPSIVTIHDFGRAGDFYFLLMEYVDGVNLRHLLRSRKLSPEEALAIVPSLCDALQYAHERGIVHRDIKPENLLLDREGRVKIADFGIAKLVDPTAAHADSTVATEDPSPLSASSAAGTPGYMAPEQKSAPHQVDSRADIYSLGVVFYEMLTGERPKGPVEPPSRKVQIDVRLDQVVLRALEKEPDLRWQSAAELRTQLQFVTGSEPSPAHARHVKPSPGRHFRRGVLVALMILLPGALIALNVAYSLGGGRAGWIGLGTIIPVLIAVLGGWIYAVRAKRNSARQGANPPLHLTTAPRLALVLVIFSFLFPLGLAGALSTASHIRYVKERRDQQQRIRAAEVVVANAQAQVKDLTRLSAEAQRKLTELTQSPTADENDRIAAERRLNDLTTKRDTAEEQYQTALQQARNASDFFHSEARPGSTVYVLSLPFAWLGTLLGWRHLLAIRSLPRPRPQQFSALVAALTWPLLIVGGAAGAAVLLPLNYGHWAMLGLVLGIIAALATATFGIVTVLRWLDGQPFLDYSNASGRPFLPVGLKQCFGVVLLVLALLVPLRWFAVVREDSGRDVRRWQQEMTSLQQEWNRAVTDRWSAQNALDTYVRATVDVKGPTQRANAEKERQRLTRELGRAEALTARLDTRMTALNELGNERRGRSFEQQLPALFIGPILGFFGFLLLRKARSARQPGVHRTQMAWVALGAVLMLGCFAMLQIYFSRPGEPARPIYNTPSLQIEPYTLNTDVPPLQSHYTLNTNVPSAQVEPEKNANASPDGKDLVTQVERRVAQAQYEKLLTELFNTRAERDSLSAQGDASNETVTRQAAALEQKIRILTQQTDELRRKIEAGAR